MTLKVILLAILALPVFKEDRAVELEKAAQLQLIAANIRMTRLSKDGVAMLIAWGWHESNYSLRIQRGECRKGECPNGARGNWQNERTGATESDWDRLVGIENTGVQVARAAWFVNWSLGVCSGDVRCAYRRLGGLQADCPLSGEDARMQTFAAVRRALQ